MQNGAYWTHVAGTWTSETGVKLYVNGTVTQDMQYKIPLGSAVLPDRMKFGLYSTDGLLLMDEWYFWDIELDEYKIMQVFNAYKQGTCIYFTLWQP